MIPCGGEFTAYYGHLLSGILQRIAVHISIFGALGYSAGEKMNLILFFFVFPSFKHRIIYSTEHLI